MAALLAWLRGVEHLYLWLDLLSLAGPLALSFDRKVAYWRLWRPWALGVLVGASVFLAWDVWFTAAGYWSFNPDYLVGVGAAGLPLEEWLFFLVIPYATVFIYECWRCYPTPRMGPRTARAVTLGLALGSVVLLVLYLDRWYTAVTFGLLLPMLALAWRLHGLRFLGLAYVGWLVSLVPFFVVNGILTAVPVVRYNDAENIGFRLGTIPVEDPFYGFLLYLIVLTVLERLRGTFRVLPTAG